ncbi:MAG: hypothetical protein GY702_07485 [Desulfobulbaceae bacterium]|nr:hypothetical protein [Desulfobulbaceae bacterium]
MKNTKLDALIESWESQARARLEEAESTSSERIRINLTESAVLNINLASQLKAITEDIGNAAALERVIEVVVPCEGKRKYIRESLRSGVIV